jgi:hypothetical protein
MMVSNETPRGDKNETSSVHTERRRGEMLPTEDLIQALPYVVPLLVLELILLVVALVDLIKRERVAGGNKIVWVLVMVFVQIIGPIVYLAIGRREKSYDSD